MSSSQPFIGKWLMVSGGEAINLLGPSWGEFPQNNLIYQAGETSNLVNVTWQLQWVLDPSTWSLTESCAFYVSDDTGCWIRFSPSPVPLKPQVFAMPWANPPTLPPDLNPCPASADQPFGLYCRISAWGYSEFHFGFKDSRTDNTTDPHEHFFPTGYDLQVSTPGARWLRDFLGGVAPSGCDYSYADISGEDYSSLTITQATFDTVNMAGTKFDGATLTGITLSGSNSKLDQTSFVGAHLDGAQFQDLHCRLTGVTFKNAVLTGANFHGTVLVDVSFEGATLSGADFSGATLMACVFDNADLTLAVFAGATFGDGDGASSFVGADLDRVDFTSVDLTNVDFGERQATPGCRHTDRPTWSSVIGQWTSFKGATVRWSVIGCNASGVDLRDVKLVGAQPKTLAGWPASHSMFPAGGLDFSGISFYDAVSGAAANFANSLLDGSKFARAELSGASFDEASLIGCNFQGAALDNATFRGSVCADTGELAATFYEAYLVGAQFVSAHLARCTFDNAALYGPTSTMSGCVLDGAHFNGARLSQLDLTSQGDTRTLTDVTFDGAQLMGTHFAGMTLDNVSFQAAFLQGADFTGATINSADMSGAVLSATTGSYVVDQQTSAPVTVSWQATVPDATRFQKIRLPGGDPGPVGNSPADVRDAFVGECLFTDPTLGAALASLFLTSDGVDFTKSVDTTNPADANRTAVQVVLSAFVNAKSPLNAATVRQLSVDAPTWQIRDESANGTAALYLVCPQHPNTSADALCEVRVTSPQTPFPAMPPCPPGSTDPACQSPHLPPGLRARIYAPHVTDRQKP